VKTISQVRGSKASKPKTKLQVKRENANIGVRELAGYSGASPATVSRIEAGKPPSIRNALLLARFFETSVEDLFGDFA
jgi:DNA-binding XRE family transcriptional regulator